MRLPSSRTLVALTVLSLLAWTGCSSDAPNDLLRPSLDPGEIVSTDAIPPGYYDTVDASNPVALRTSLHEIIDDHVRYPYTSTATDTWDILEDADQDPNDSGNILDVYRNASYAKQGGGNTFYQREHAWPKSYGFPNDNSSNYPYTDCHHLFLCDGSYNSSRSNKPFRYCDAGCTEYPTEVNDGAGGGSGVYPGNSDWSSGAYTQGTWEVWIGRRGDIARAMFYMDVRYEGGVHGVTGDPEPDLILTDDEQLIDASNTGSNESVAYMGMLSVLLQWNDEDPVDDKERRCNDEVFAFQGNRNPFVDHPEWIDCIFSGQCGGGDTTPPAVPTGLLATGGDGQVDLDWDDNTEPDLAGYNVLRSTTSGGPYSQINGALASSSDFTDGGVTNGTTYYYVVTAVDTSTNESAASNEASATPVGSGGGAVVWINEFHYDNTGGDTGEFIEVAGTAGTSLGGWQLLGYNGNGGGVYGTVNLTGSLPDQQGGFGTLAFAFTGLQNGSPDGIALVNGGTVVEFLSYEGVLTATDGPAAGMTSVDVGVTESSSTPVGYSLQRVGSGTAASDFTWEGPIPETSGAPNTGQTFGSGGGDTTPPAAPSGLVATAGDGQVDLDWLDNTEPDLDGYNVYRSTTTGGPYGQLNGTPLATSDYADSGVTNGVTYYYVITAVDTSSNESAYGNEASATPAASGGGTSMHVESIVLSAVQASRKHDNARAEVTILDDGGNPVAGATVTGTFTGNIDETVTAATNGSGVATLTTSGKAKRPISFGFCVDDVTASGFTYDSGANVETCDSFGSS